MAHPPIYTARGIYDGLVLIGRIAAFVKSGDGTSHSPGYSLLTSSLARVIGSITNGCPPVDSLPLFARGRIDAFANILCLNSDATALQGQTVHPDLQTKTAQAWSSNAVHHEVRYSILPNISILSLDQYY